MNAPALTSPSSLSNRPLANPSAVTAETKNRAAEALNQSNDSPKPAGIQDGTQAKVLELLPAAEVLSPAERLKLAHKLLGAKGFIALKDGSQIQYTQKPEGVYFESKDSPTMLLDVEGKLNYTEVAKIITNIRDRLGVPAEKVLEVDEILRSL